MKQPITPKSAAARFGMHGFFDITRDFRFASGSGQFGDAGIMRMAKILSYAEHELGRFLSLKIPDWVM